MQTNHAFVPSCSHTIDAQHTATPSTLSTLYLHGMQVAGLMGVMAHKASDSTREAAQATVERAEAALRAAQDHLQHTSGKVCRSS